MKTTTDKWLYGAFALLALALFAFFYWGYPYHLYHKEQMSLFLWDLGYMQQYQDKGAWVAYFLGDLLTQGYYYIGGGPLILSSILTVLGVVSYYCARHLVGKRMAFVIALLILLWETGRCCTLSYPLASTLSLLMGEALFLFLRHQFRPAVCKSGKLYYRIPILLVTFAAGYLCLGYGVWAGVIWSLLYELKQRQYLLSGLLVASFGLMPLLHQAPATTWWGLPDFDREYVLGLDVEHYFGNEGPQRELLKQDRCLTEASFYRNLHAATHPDPMTGAGLSADLFAYYQPGTEGLILPVDPSSNYLRILFAGELWFTLGDMVMAEHSAMLAMIFSPNQISSRMLKRLAEIQLVKGDNAAALKYLRILRKSWTYRTWAERRMQGMLSETLRSFFEKQREQLIQTDFLRKQGEVIPTLRQLAKQNNVAYEYLLCYHLLRKDLAAFEADYQPGRIQSRLFEEAQLICLAQQKRLQPEVLAAYQISSATATAFADFTARYERHDPELKALYGQSYWFHFLMRK